MEERRSEVQTAWQAQIPDEQWSVYQRVLAEARARGLRYALGGAVALATYTGQWRNTKDLDLFILPAERDAVVEMLASLGLEDYFEREEYDRGWIYRTCLCETIVDVIWSMANRRAEVDEDWLTRGPSVELRGEVARVLPAEEVIWNKIYILHHDRCDWTDVLNLIYAVGPELDWQRLLDCLDPDERLLAGVMSVFAWLCPGRAAALPAWLWERLQLTAPQTGSAPEVDRQRVDLLDSRPWFFGTEG